MLDGRTWTNLELMGFTIIGNSVPYFHVIEFKLSKIKKEGENMNLIISEIKKFILDDLLEAIENDLEVKSNNCNPLKWIKELVYEGLL